MYSSVWQQSFIQDARRRLRRGVDHVAAPPPPPPYSCTSFGDWRAGVRSSCRAPKTNYKDPRPPAGKLHAGPGSESLIVSTHRWALTRGRHWDGQMGGDPAGPGYRFYCPDLDGKVEIGITDSGEASNLMFYLNWSFSSRVLDQNSRDLRCCQCESQKI